MWRAQATGGTVSLTGGLQRLFPLRISFCIDVTGDVVKGEEEVVLFMQLGRKLNLYLDTK